MLMNSKRREENRKVRKTESDDFRTRIKADSRPPVYGTGNRSDRYWVLQAPNGRNIELLITHDRHPVLMELAQGYTVEELAPVTFDFWRGKGMVVVDAVTLKPVTDLRPPAVDSYR